MAPKISQDQITAVKPPLVPWSAFSSSSLLVADPFQYHLGEAAGAAYPRQEQKWNFAVKALYPTEILPGLTHICWLTYQQLLTNTQGKGFSAQSSNTVIKLFFYRHPPSGRKVCSISCTGMHQLWNSKVTSPFKYIQIWRSNRGKKLLKGNIYFNNSIFKFFQQSKYYIIMSFVHWVRAC